MSALSPVKQLNSETARKIAAGEVIEKPASIIRELLDNSIDSGAENITVEITDGGIEKIRILDNGSGMTKEDLQNCARPHATSKIQDAQDLLKLSTLGFRGEALASIAAVSRLSIMSGGYKMRASITEDHLIEKTADFPGTIVQSEGLFENFPARRQFLKRPANEAIACKNMFIEKTLPCPNISFRFVQDGEIKIDLQKNQTLLERFVKATGINEDISLFNEITASSSVAENPDWSFKIIIGEPSVHRNNKKSIFIFVNGRKITEYSLVQAIEYGGQGYFPNGTFPVACAFINVNPALVDFNIHPTKSEVRFKDISSLHHGISSEVKNFFLKYTNSSKINQDNFFSKPIYSINHLFSQTNQSYSQSDNYVQKIFSQEKNDFKSKKVFTPNASNFQTQKTFPLKTQSLNTPLSEQKNQISSSQNIIDNAINAYNIKEKQTSYENQNISTMPEQSEIKNNSFHYLGLCLGTFILAEKNNTLFIIDQHAADERFIFDEIMQNQGKKQALLLPYTIQTKNKEEDDYLERIKDELEKIGFSTRKKSEGLWEFTSINERWTGSELDLAHDLLDKKANPHDLIYSVAAMTACKAAVKDGWTLLDDTAKLIAERALSLPDPHCPHGRPVYTTITRDELFKLVRRTE